MREKHVLAIDIPTVPSIHELVYKPISYVAMAIPISLYIDIPH